MKNLLKKALDQPGVKWNSPVFTKVPPLLAMENDLFAIHKGGNAVIHAIKIKKGWKLIEVSTDLWPWKKDQYASTHQLQKFADEHGFDFDKYASAFPEK